jgi:CRISPR/Cas system Type II protein with McrA/HNH and RuvC-like nuclease domain
LSGKLPVSRDVGEVYLSVQDNSVSQQDNNAKANEDRKGHFGRQLLPEFPSTYHEQVNAKVEWWQQAYKICMWRRGGDASTKQ